MQSQGGRLLTISQTLQNILSQEKQVCSCTNLIGRSKLIHSCRVNIAAQPPTNVATLRLTVTVTTVQTSHHVLTMITTADQARND